MQIYLLVRCFQLLSSSMIVFLSAVCFTGPDKKCIVFLIKIVNLLHFSLLIIQKYSNSLTQHRRNQNLNVPLPQFSVLLPSSFLRHLKKWVPCVYINIKKKKNIFVRYICNVHPFPQLWLCVVTSRSR